MDDTWTHQGIFRYALDFVRYGANTDTASSTYQGTGTQLEDYFAFNQPIYSPIWGRVILVVNAEWDNPIGAPNEFNRWGNHIIIEDHRGFYVVLAHFKQWSIPILAGQWVEPGQYLGLCGNSGYSPQPHVHLHVQAGPHIGSVTLPFELLNYTTQNNRYTEQGLPQRGDVIACVLPQPYYQHITTFLYDSEMRFEHTCADSTHHTASITVKAVPHALGQWHTSDGGIIDFIKRGQSFYAHQLVKKSPMAQTLMCAYASLPQCYQPHLTWQDVLPIEALPSVWDRLRLNTMVWLMPTRAMVRATYRFVDAHTIVGVIDVPRWFGAPKQLNSTLQLDPYQRISAFSLDQDNFQKGLES